MIGIEQEARLGHGLASFDGLESDFISETR
jgi:hypothetical protein